MKANELIKGQIYKNITDLEMPIMFLNIEYKETELSNDYFVCRFKTVKTERNKNWHHGEILSRFHSIDGNNLITL